MGFGGASHSEQVEASPSPGDMNSEKGMLGQAPRGTEGGLPPGGSPLPVSRNAPGTPVDDTMARVVMQNKAPVCTSEVYKKRLPEGATDASAGGMGLIMAVHAMEEGLVCDVLWDTGKAYSGYCCGFRGCFDLLLADPRTKRPVNPHSPQAAAPGALSVGKGVDKSPASDAQLDCTVGYLASAPKVSHVGGKHIWSSSGPLFNRGSPKPTTPK
mmetsp:Transcript_64274/g.134106  ORF Transcript_64274/g.134106 Transcript_64274/m.134106 type:complete len:213 (-) Transcript_64274:171-809(-)|eukprot:CAMPEP_0181300174 /NCGR_PEP_ID=MMETSP1101-20121128/6747_1 /TAXON_ID=46948 /ORGANISM="Rhodomonas abbreviata, Strain Caron Lab Isolate" /LENGTH=212 /DNA_ID=CAMNT_0023405389 /DNA_START=152 /DNA_END=790 /DNA_ORIENTATION=+